MHSICIRLVCSPESQLAETGGKFLILLWVNSLHLPEDCPFSWLISEALTLLTFCSSLGRAESPRTEVVETI